MQGMTGIQAYDGETAWGVMPFMGKSDPEEMAEDQAAKQDIRPLKIGLLNLMPKKIQTENQFARLIGATMCQRFSHTSSGKLAKSRMFSMSVPSKRRSKIQPWCASSTKRARPGCRSRSMCVECAACARAFRDCQRTSACSACSGVSSNTRAFTASRTAAESSPSFQWAQTEPDGSVNGLAEYSLR